MKTSMQISFPKAYSWVFSLACWALCVAPLLRMDLSAQSLDQAFLGRAQLVAAFNTLRLGLGDRIFNNVLVGRDGWLFFTGDASMNDFQKSDPFSKDQLAQYQDQLTALNDYCRARGILFIVVIAPDKSTIYPQDMPREMQVVGNTSRLDQLVRSMKQQGHTPILDLRAPLLQAAKTQQLYFKTDTHWNPSGQYVAYTRLIQVLERRYPGMRPLPMSAFATTSQQTTLDLPHIMGLTALPENLWRFLPASDGSISREPVPAPGGYSLLLSQNSNPNLPNLLIYHDSFFASFIPLLEPHFSHITWVWHYVEPKLWNRRWIDQVHPNVVIFELAERYLNYGADVPPAK